MDQTLVKMLREATSAGMKDCVLALDESGGNFLKAVDIVKAKGLQNVAARVNKIAGEGTVAIYCNAEQSSMIELNCQTDFVAKSPEFLSDLVRRPSLGGDE